MAKDRRNDRQLLPRYAVLFGAAGKREVVYFSMAIHYR